MKYSNKIIASSLAALMAAAMIPWDVYGAAPEVSVDETAYIKLDYYGGAEEFSVVKACNLNGNRSFTDYGEYESVSNMSNRIEPVLENGAVTWNLDDASDRFYFECTPKNANAIDIPWTFDVSYELNGVPKRAEELAGASGLVTVKVEAIPNESVNQYYQDNMVLVTAMLVDTQKVSSFSAPGAQLQTIGSNQAACYLATPGQHTTFHFQIGTDSFETMGVFMAMVPATLSQLDETGGIRDDKERVKKAARALEDTFDDILDIFDSLSWGLRTTQGGLAQLNDAREELYQARGELYDSGEQMRESMAQMRDRLNVLAEVMGDESGCLKGVGRGVVRMADSLDSVGSDVDDVSRALDNLQDSLRELKKAPDSIKDSQIQSVQNQLADLQSLLEKLGSSADLSALQAQISELEAQLEQVDQVPGGSPSSGDTQEMEERLEEIESDLDYGISSMETLLDSIGEETGGQEERAANAAGRIMDLLKAMDQALSLMMKGQGDLDTLANDINGQIGEIENLIPDTGWILEEDSLSEKVSGFSSQMQEIQSLIGLLPSGEEAEESREDLDEPFTVDAQKELEDSISLLSRDVEEASRIVSQALDGVQAAADQKINTDDVNQKMAALKAAYQEYLRAKTNSAKLQALTKVRKGLIDLQRLLAGSTDENAAAAQKQAADMLVQTEAAIVILKILDSPEMSGVNQFGQTLSAILNSMIRELDSIAGSISGALSETSGVVNGISNMGDDIGGAGDSVERILLKTETTLESTGRLLDSVSAFSLSAENILRRCENLFNNGTKQTLDGLTEFLGKAADGLAKTDDLRENKDTITDVIEEE